jgi:hypothetical protein
MRGWFLPQAPRGVKTICVVYARGMRVAWIVLAVGLVAGCKGSAPAAAAAVKMETPRGTADGLLTAFAGRDGKLAATLLPPEDLLKASFDCPDDKLVKDVNERRANTPKEMEGIPKGATVEIAQFDKSGSSDKQLRTGDEWEGCKTKKMVTVHLAKVDLRVTQDGKTDFSSQTWTFLKFGDEPKWYLVK